MSQALWQEATRAELVEHIDRHCPKRRQGLTTGQYLAIAAINRAISPRSKRSLWDWFSQTVLRRHLPAASPAALNSQRFWDHMDAVKPEAATAIWKDLLKDVVHREGIDLSSICYDGTNFYIFLDTFNTRCSLAVRGKNRTRTRQPPAGELRPVLGRRWSVAVVLRRLRREPNDSRQFSLVLERFHQFYRELAGGAVVVPETTLIFDKGNNSADNFRLLDSLKLKFVGSVKQNEHPELAQVPHTDPRFVVCTSPGLKGAKAFRVTKIIAGCERVLVVTYNPNLARPQWMTLQNDVAKASKRLSELQGRLAGRAAGLIKGGKRPTLASVEQKCRSILRRQYLEDAIRVTIEGDPKGYPQLNSTTRQRARKTGDFPYPVVRTFAFDGSHQDMEVGRMPYKWPADTDFALWELDVLDRACPACGRMMYICDHRYRRLHTLEGPVQLVCKLNHCPDRDCPGHAKTKSPELEATIAPPSWAIGWDVFCWIGHRRCSRHMSIPHIQSELLDDYAIKLSRRCHRQVHPALPGHARRASARPRGPPPAIRIGR